MSRRRNAPEDEVLVPALKIDTLKSKPISDIINTSSLTTTTSTNMLNNFLSMRKNTNKNSTPKIDLNNKKIENIGGQKEAIAIATPPTAMQTTTTIQKPVLLQAIPSSDGGKYEWQSMGLFDEDDLNNVFFFFCFFFFDTSNKFFFFFFFKNFFFFFFFLYIYIYIYDNLLD
jgi:hypothetical protein